MRSRSLRFLSVLVLSVTAACGGGSSSAKSAATEGALKTAVAKFGDSILQGEASDAYAYFTKECRNTVAKSEFALMMTFGVAFIEGFADVKASDLRTGDVEVRNFSSTRAEARAEVREKNGDLFSDADSEDWTEWVYEDGGWHTTDCADFGDGLDFSEDGDLDFSMGPPCSDLVDGQPVPPEFVSETSGEIDLSCESDDTYEFAMRWECFSSEREYSYSDLGFAFLDEGIFRSGEVRGCAPPCSDLVNGQPVPSSFDDESEFGFSLSCEDANGDEQWSYDWDCYSSDRRYMRNDDGYAFIDERVYRSGSPDNC